MGIGQRESLNPIPHSLITEVVISPAQSNVSSGCLNGLRVLDLSRVLAGPFCTQLLGDMGAEIIKIEQPGQGDDTRQWGPPWFHGESAYYLSCNRNKKSVTINLKHQTGQELLRRLAEDADVVVENFKVGALKKYGLDYDSLRAVNPRVIYCSITGYGQTGPYKNLSGYDFIVQAQGGIMSITGEAEGEPCKVGVAIGDIMAGMYAANAILAALVQRQQSNAGQHIDIALLDSQVSWLANVAMNYLVSHELPRRYGNAHPNLVPYQPFATQDGHIAIGVGNDEQFKRMCEQLQREDLAQHTSYRTNALRVQNRAALIAALQHEFRKRTTGEWLALMARAEVPAGRSNTIPEVLEDEQVRAREMVQHILHASGESVPLLGPVAKFSATPAKIHLPPPLLGQHTEEVLRERLQLSAEEIKTLRAERIV